MASLPAQPGPERGVRAPPGFGDRKLAVGEALLLCGSSRVRVTGNVAVGVGGNLLPLAKRQI